MHFWQVDVLGRWRGRLRVLAAIPPWLALPSFLYCGGHHLCMDGHLAHGPYPAWEWFSDYFWSGGFVAAAVLALFSNMRLRLLFSLCLLLLPVLQIYSPSPSGPGSREDALGFTALVVSLHSLFGGLTRNEQKPAKAKRWHRAVVSCLGLFFVGTSVVLFLLASYRTPAAARWGILPVVCTGGIWLIRAGLRGRAEDVASIAERFSFRQ